MYEDKGRGKTRACKKCGDGIASRIKFLIVGWSLHIFCRNPECRYDNEITLGFKPIVLVSGLVVILVCFLIYENIQAHKISCNSFKSQIEAQKFFDSDRTKYQILDKNHNNVPCEDLLN